MIGSKRAECKGIITSILSRVIVRILGYLRVYVLLCQEQ
ncbi:hypothetical protein APHNP_1521 [Anaplasma phagocytophilum str. ApNP]|uniref:Uncharacterized protein n=2 Tax=Anaplasma phagocytophilum TaxID=948 RepID=A0A0F3NH63_ANAPH|nr:hypothetical protein APHMUC_1662 [Anaplasma phagocytophilum str. ApMUC09]KJV67380.1 hypothetical protein APHNP_1521 [Anaplasma phagocytophilum str. ApNP]